MTEFVRVKDKETGHHYSVAKERFDLTPDLWTVLKQDATNSVGDPLPPKYKTEIASASTNASTSKDADEKANPAN